MMYSVPKRYFVLIGFSVIILIFYSLDSVQIIHIPPKPLNLPVLCYFAEKKTNNSLPLLDEKTVKKNSSIFFLETSCHDKFHLNPRQACAVESAAKLHPKSDIYILVAAPVKMESPQPFQAELMLYNNVKIRQIDMKSYFNETPLDILTFKTQLQSSKWLTVHVSDILRFITLWKFGGTYLDLDFVILRPFDKLVNFVGAESTEDIANGFFSFSYQHEVANLGIKDLKHNFRGYDWSYNGPGLITRALKIFCNVSKVIEMTEEKCKGFKVFKPSVFYPIKWRQWKDYFVTAAKDVDRVMAKLNESIAIHVWNHHSKNTPVIVNSNQPYSILASRFCPRVYNSIKGTF